MKIILASIFLMAILWWGACEYIRGKQGCPGSRAYWLAFIGPLGGIILCLLGLLLIHISRGG